MKVKEKSEKADIKLNIQKTKIMTSGPITSWQIDREKLKKVIAFIFLGSKITVATKLKDVRSLEEQSKLSILKSREVTLLTKVCIVKTMVFPIVM